MSIKATYTTEKNLDKAIAEIAGAIASGIAPKVVIYFASSAFEPEALAAGMQKAFPSSATLGCSTAGEIASGCMLDHAIVAMRLDGNVVEDVAIAMLGDIRADARSAVEDAFASFQARTGQSMAQLDPSKFVGIILADGLAGAEEGLMDRIGDLTNITFIGGSAGDDLKFQQTYVHANGKAYSGAAVLALVKPRNGFEILTKRVILSLEFM